MCRTWVLFLKADNRYHTRVGGIQVLWTHKTYTVALRVCHEPSCTEDGLCGTWSPGVSPGTGLLDPKGKSETNSSRSFETNTFG